MIACGGHSPAGPRPNPNSIFLKQRHTNIQKYCITSMPICKPSTLDYFFAFKLWLIFEKIERKTFPERVKYQQQKYLKRNAIMTELFFEIELLIIDIWRDNFFLYDAAINKITSCLSYSIHHPFCNYGIKKKANYYFEKTTTWIHFFFSDFIVHTFFWFKTFF